MMITKVQIRGALGLLDMKPPDLAKVDGMVSIQALRRFLKPGPRGMNSNNLQHIEAYLKERGVKFFGKTGVSLTED